MNTFSVYLTFKDNCEDAFKFYAGIFDAEIAMMSRFKEMPPDENFPIAEEDGEKLMHISLQINPQTMLMGSDTPGPQAEEFVAGNNFSISIEADSTEEVDKLFAALSEGGMVVMPPDNTFWGSYFGMCRDKFDVNWMVSCQT